MFTAQHGPCAVFVNAIFFKVMPGAFNWKILLPALIVAKSLGLPLVPPLIIKLGILTLTT